MLFRIDRKHFLTHAIDFFSYDELIAFQYLIISAKIACSSRANNCVKCSWLYPNVDTIYEYSATGSKDVLKNMYLAMLNPDTKMEKLDMDSIMYKFFINPLENHYNVMIVCDEDENVYIDYLCEHLKKDFSIEAIDLNELFTKGHVGPIYLDFSEIHDKAVDVRRAALTEETNRLSQTTDGRYKIVTTMMSTKQKLKKLKQYGVTLSKDDMKNIDNILLTEWNAEEGDGD